MDLRVENIFREELQGDNSFNEKVDLLSLIFGGNKYSQADMKTAWHNGIKHGIEIGLRKASLEGQRIELNQNTNDERQNEFLSRFYQLADDYKCTIQYHPEIGMSVIDILTK